MIEPAEFNPDEIPAVTLAGKQWPVPVLAWRQLKACRGDLLELSRKISEAVEAEPLGAEAEEDAHINRNLRAVATVIEGLPDDDYDRLVMGPIFSALTALHPKLTRDEFESWASGEMDRCLAWLTVRRQSGLFGSRGESAAPETDTQGEGKGAA